MNLMCDGVIFDVDGTIWDSTAVVEHAWNKALEDAGFDIKVTAGQLKGLFGLPMDVILERVMPGSTVEERNLIQNSCYKYEQEFLEREPGALFPGICEAIQELSRKMPVYIVSNCQSGCIELVLKKTGLEDYVADYNCFGDTGLYKAENIKLMVEKHGLKHPVYVGDTVMDADACKKAGVRFIYAAYGFGKADNFDAIIYDPEDIVYLFDDAFDK